MIQNKSNYKDGAIMTEEYKKTLRTVGNFGVVLIVIIVLALTHMKMQRRISYLENEVENIKLAQTFVYPVYRCLPYYSYWQKPEIIQLDTSMENYTDIQYYTDEDAVMIAKLLYRECRGVSSKAEQSAVVWTVLNRVDDRNEFPDTISGVIQQKKQFAYQSDAPVTDELLELSYDVLDRWNREKNGETDVGRVLPKEYEYFYGDGVHNHFYKLNSDNWRVEWDFQWGSPYGD